MNISIICPLYNAETYIENLHKSILNQNSVEIESIKYILTECNDNTEKKLNEIGTNYERIRKNEFSHSLTREKDAFNSKGDIIVFISQDIIIRDELWLYNLTKDIIDGNCEAAFSRQICENTSIEKYIRENNYPDKSRIVSKKDIEKLGLVTFFFSDASSAVSKEIFMKLKGYDNKNLIINEDMYFAHKLIMNDYRIKYCADSVVTHSHCFKLKQLYKRYYDTGVFFKKNSYFQQYNANKSGIKSAKYVFKRAREEKNYKVLFGVFLNFGVRFVGMKMGKK